MWGFIFRRVSGASWGACARDMRRIESLKSRVRNQCSDQCARGTEKRQRVRTRTRSNVAGKDLVEVAANPTHCSRPDCAQPRKTMLPKPSFPHTVRGGRACTCTGPCRTPCSRTAHFCAPPRRRPRPSRFCSPPPRRRADQSGTVRGRRRVGGGGGVSKGGENTTHKLCMGSIWVLRELGGVGEYQLVVFALLRHGIEMAYLVLEGGVHAGKDRSCVCV